MKHLYQFKVTGIVPAGYAATVSTIIKVYVRNGVSRDIIVTDKIVLQNHNVRRYKKYKQNQWELFPINAVPIITCRPYGEPEIKLHDFGRATQVGNKVFVNEPPKEETQKVSKGLVQAERLKAKKKALCELWCSLERVRAKTSGDPQLDKQLIALFGVWNRPMSKHWSEPVECQQRLSLRKPAKAKDEFLARPCKEADVFAEKIEKLYAKKPK